MSLVTVYPRILKSLDVSLIVISALLFLVGTAFAPSVVNKDVKFLMRYPLWIWDLLKKRIKPEDSFLKIFALIFCLNSISLFFNILSGFLIVLPFVFAFLIGMHTGIISFKEIGKSGLVVAIANPVSVFEFPATWISLSVGMKVGLSLYSTSVFSSSVATFAEGLWVYVFSVLQSFLSHKSLLCLHDRVCGSL